MEKDFIYSQRGRTAFEHMQLLLNKGIIPMISVEKLEKSKVFKQIDNYLTTNGFCKVYVDRCQIDKYVVRPAHYEYHKMENNKQ